MLTNARNDSPDGDDGLADGVERVGERIAARLRPCLVRLDAVQFVDQRAVVVLQADRLACRAAARREAAHQPLQQPGAEGVEPLDRAMSMATRLRGAMPARLASRSRLERAGVLRESRRRLPASRKPVAFASCSIEQCFAHQQPAETSSAGALETPGAVLDHALANLSRCAAQPGCTSYNDTPLASPSPSSAGRLPATFTISRGAKTEAVVVVAELGDGKASRRAANACPMPDMAKASRASLRAIEAMRAAT